MAERPRPNEEATRLLAAAAVADGEPEAALRCPVDGDRVDGWSPEAEDMEAAALEGRRRRAITTALLTLSPIEHRVLAMRFELTSGAAEACMDEPTLASIGEAIGVSGGRVRQIEAKALRKLKHPFRSRALRPLIDFTEQRYADQGPDVDPAWRHWDARGRMEGPYARWDWHACSMTMALQDRGALPSLEDILASTRHRSSRNEWVAQTTVEHAGMRLVISAKPQTLMVSVASFGRKFQYQDTTAWRPLVAGYAGRHVITGRIEVTPWEMPETLRIGLLGRPLVHVIEHELLGGMEVTRVDPVRGLIEIAGETRRLPPE